MGEIGVELGLGRYITFSREENTFATFVKCLNEFNMLQINNSRKLKWNLNALLKINKFKNLENLTKDFN